MTIELPFIRCSPRLSPKSSWYGDCLPSRLPAGGPPSPGRLPLDKLVSETIGLTREEAFHKAERMSAASSPLMGIELVTTDGIFALDGGE